MSKDRTIIHSETDNIVFFEPSCLSYTRGPLDEGMKYGEPSFSAQYWYDYGDRIARTPVKDRWVYLFAKSSVGGGGGWRLLQEYYVDPAGKYWRSDDNALFIGSAEDQQLHSAAARARAMEATRKSGAANAYMRAPHYVHSKRCAVVSFAMAFAMPSTSVADMTGLADGHHLPAIIGWKGETPILFSVGRVAAGEGAPHAVLTVDPLELAIRTNLAFEQALSEFQLTYRGQSKQEIFARELHQFLSLNQATFSHVKDQLAGGSLDRIWSTFSRVEKKLLDQAFEYEVLAELLCHFIRSPLWTATASAYRFDDHDAVVQPGQPSKIAILHESENVVYFLYKLNAALRQIGVTAAGDKLLVELAQRTGPFQEDSWIEYVWPSKPLADEMVPHVKNGCAAVLSVYSAVLQRSRRARQLFLKNLEATEFGRILEALGLHGAKFVSVKHDKQYNFQLLKFDADLPKEFELLGDTIVLSNEDREAIAAKVEEATERIKERKLYANVEEALNLAHTALDALCLMLTMADFAEKARSGEAKWQDGVSVAAGVTSVASTLVARFIAKNYTEKAGKIALKRLERAGAIVGLVSAAVDILGSVEQYRKGNYGVALGKGTAGAMGLAGGLVALTMGTPVGWVAAVLTIGGIAGSMIAEYYTLGELEEFIKFCDWGVGADRDAQLAQQPMYSRHSFGEWRGNYEVQRDALSRILCAFELEGIDDGKVRIQLGRCGPRGAVYLWWRIDYRLDKGDTQIGDFKQDKEHLRIPVGDFHDGFYVAAAPPRWHYLRHETLTATVWLDVEGNLSSESLDPQHIPSNSGGCSVVTWQAIYPDHNLFGSARKELATHAKARSLAIQEGE